MRITKEEIKKLEPCKDGYEWYLENQEEDLLTLLLKLNDNKPEWARWLFSRKMNTKQKRLISIFAAEQVLHLFENKYPHDDRPRKAIESAKVVLISDSFDNRVAAYAAAYAANVAFNAAANVAFNAAAYAAYAAANAAYAAAYAAYAAANAAYAAANAEFNAAYAAYAAAYAAYAAANAEFNAAYAADGRKEMQVRIIKEAVRILEYGEHK